MIRHKPTQRYCGLTVIMSNPSRFDKDKNCLITAGGGRLFDEFLSPYTRFNCDIRVKEDMGDLLPDTKCILLLGEPAAHQWVGNTDNSLNEMRGSVFRHKVTNVPMICSYFPQDCADPKNFEKEFNSEFNEDDVDNEEGNQLDEKSRKNNTKRKNYRFWLKQDIKKIKYLLQNNGVVPEAKIKPTYIIAPKSSDIIRLLRETKGKDMFIDIETFVPSCDMQCFAFSFNDEPNIYCVPVFSHDGSWAYSNLPTIFKSLAFALRDNNPIAHNGAHFDYLVFTWKYKLAIGPKPKDTMCMMHRCYTEVEKSLGHCISLWTWESFHKDEGTGGYYTPSQVAQKLQYCGKDVYGMKLVYYAMIEHAKKIPGLQQSFDNVNSMIRPYLIITLQGIAFDEEMRKKIIKENDRLCMHYMKWARIFIGEQNIKMIAGKSKSSILNSNKQCCIYFHDLLGYDVVAKGKEKEDGSRGPSLAKKAMYKLRMKYDNPVIDLCLAFRSIIRETGYLNFTPWQIDILQKDKQEQLPLNI